MTPSQHPLELPCVDAKVQWIAHDTHRYYTAWLHQDLLGDLVLSTFWGGIGNRLGGQAHKFMPNAQIAQKTLQQLDNTRRRRGYVRTS